MTDKPEKDWPKKDIPSSSNQADIPLAGVQATSTQTSVNSNGQEVTTTIYKTANPFVNVTYAATSVAANGITTTAGSAATSTTNAVNKVEITSRAKMILDKVSLPAPILASTTNDVLDTAVKRGLKLISSKKMIEFLDQTVHFPGVQNPSLLLVAGSLSSSSDESKIKSVRAIPLTAPFIKVESMDQKYRPTQKVFTTWPELTLDPGVGCPFRLTTISLEVQKMQQEVRAARRAAEEKEKSRVMTESRESGVNLMNHTPRNARGNEASGITTGGPSTNNSMYNNLLRANLRGPSKLTPEVNGCSGHGKVTPLSVSVKTNGSITTTPKVLGRKDTLDQRMLANNPSTSKKVQQQQIKKKSPSYCEICCEEFDNMQKVSRCCLKKSSFKSAQ